MSLIINIILLIAFLIGLTIIAKLTMTSMFLIGVFAVIFFIMYAFPNSVLNAIGIILGVSIILWLLH